MFKLRPMKCEVCALRFPVALAGFVKGPTEEVDLNLPFRPVEMDDVPLPPPARNPEPSLRARLGFRQAWCPSCGSESVRPAHAGTNSRGVFRFDAKVALRCALCNASFLRFNPVLFLVRSALLVAVLGTLTYLALHFRVWYAPGENTPRIRQDQIPPLPPPVFR